MALTYPIALVGLLALPYFLWVGRPQGMWGRGRAILALVLRFLIIIALVFALAGLQIIKAADQLAVVFLIDASDSMSAPAVESARLYVQDVMDRMGSDDEAAIIVFGSDALVERPMSAISELGPLESEVLPLNTDLAEAIRLGMALYPPGAARRMVILSDGLANIGDAAEAARLANASGIEIVAVPFSTITGSEVLVTDVSAPTRLNEGQIFDLSVAIESSLETTAVLRVIGGGQVLVEESVGLLEGINRYTFTLTATEPGLTAFRVQVIPAGEDIFYQNNELSAFTQVVGPPRVLIVADDEQEITNLAQALLEQGLLVDHVTGLGLPADLSTLSGYQSVILANVPARNLGQRKMQLLQTYVRDLGGGLVVIGGPNAFGVGGYFQTPLEETLPVEMQLKDQERLPQMTVVYVIDKSGSMSDSSLGGFQKIELAKEAVIRSVNLLGPLDRVGVVPFDESASWAVPIGPASNRSEIARLVGGIRAGGGTDIYAGVLAVSKQLPDDPSQLRHIVLLTDGGASPSGIAELVEQMYTEYGITLSVIAIGQGYAPFIEELPELADGRFHYAYDVDTIPEIFTEETVIATRAYIIENEFFPALASSSEIMSGIDATPSLYGYIGTSIKPTARQILVTDKDDPLLAAWQYGLGRSVAWTSDASGRWATNWISWDEYARLWSQAVRWTITEGATQNVEVRVVQEGETARIFVDAQSEEGEYLNGLEMDANVVLPDLTTIPVTLSQVAPGRYEGVFEPGEEGAYFVRVAGADDVAGDQGAVAQTSGWVLSYSPEYRSLTGDPDYLSYVAGLAGGDVIEDPAEIFAHNLRLDRSSQPIWPWLVLAATILLPFDIAVRRLILTRSDLVRLAAWLGIGRRRAAEAVQPRTSSAGALFAAKERAEQATAQRASTQIPTPTTRIERDEVAAPESPPPPERVSPAPKPTRAPTRSGSTASSLLRSKRDRDRSRDDD